MASSSAADINNGYNSVGSDSPDRPKPPQLTHRGSSTPGTPGGARNDHHHHAEQGKYGKTDNLVFHDDYYGYQHITRIREIFRPPVVRQVSRARKQRCVDTVLTRTHSGLRMYVFRV